MLARAYEKDIFGYTVDITRRRKNIAVYWNESSGTGFSELLPLEMIGNGQHKDSIGISSVETEKLKVMYHVFG